MAGDVGRWENRMDAMQEGSAVVSYEVGVCGVDEANEVAPSALYHLALAFHRMGNAKEGCLTLRELQFRYADLDISVHAHLAEAQLACV